MSDSPDDSSVAAIPEGDSVRGILEAAAAPVAIDKTPINARTGGSRSAGINWAAAFVLFCKGMSLDEIAGQFGCNVNVLQKRHRAEDWGALAAKSRALVAPPVEVSDLVLSAEETERKARRIQANREKALSVAEKLRAKIEEALQSIDDRADAFAGHIREFLKRLESGEIMETESIGYFLERVEEWDDARVGNILGLAKSAKLVDETSMVALGDVAQKGGNLGNPTRGDTYFINLPQAASQPRMKRAEPVAALPASAKPAPAGGGPADDPEPPPPIDPPGAPEVDPPYQQYESDGPDESGEVIEADIIGPGRDDSRKAKTVGDTVDFDKL